MHFVSFWDMAPHWRRLLAFFSSSSFFPFFGLFAMSPTMLPSLVGPWTPRLKWSPTSASQVLCWDCRCKPPCSSHFHLSNRWAKLTCEIVRYLALSIVSLSAKSQGTVCESCSLCSLLRHLLMTHQILRNVPPIVFVQDRRNALLAEVWLLNNSFFIIIIINNSF